MAPIKIQDIYMRIITKGEDIEDFLSMDGLQLLLTLSLSSIDIICICIFSYVVLGIK